MRHLILPLFLLLPACATIADEDWTNSGFRATSGGEIPATLTGEINGSVTGAIGSVFSVAGLSSDGAVAFSGIAPSTDVGSPVSGGSAVLVGEYDVVGVEDIYVVASSDFEGQIYGTTFQENGPITLTADFSGGTLRGSAGNLSVAGNITGGALSGGVSYSGDAGTLTGDIGTLGAVGAFHGNDDDRVFAGGFVVVND